MLNSVYSIVPHYIMSCSLLITTLSTFEIFPVLLGSHQGVELRGVGEFDGDHPPFFVGLSLTSSGCSFNASLTRTISPLTGEMSSEVALTDSISPNFCSSA